MRTGAAGASVRIRLGGKGESGRRPDRTAVELDRVGRRRTPARGRSRRRSRSGARPPGTSGRSRHRRSGADRDRARARRLQPDRGVPLADVAQERARAAGPSPRRRPTPAGRRSDPPAVPREPEHGEREQDDRGDDEPERGDVVRRTAGSSRSCRAGPAMSDPGSRSTVASARTFMTSFVRCAVLVMKMSNEPIRRSRLCSTLPRADSKRSASAWNAALSSSGATAAKSAARNAANTSRSSLSTRRRRPIRRRSATRSARTSSPGRPLRARRSRRSTASSISSTDLK